jgi:ABC-type polysaccharide transport system permease subunit
MDGATGGGGLNFPSGSDLSLPGYWRKVLISMGIWLDISVKSCIHRAYLQNIDPDAVMQFDPE